MQHSAYVLLMVIRWHKIPAEVLKQGFHEQIRQGNKSELEEIPLLDIHNRVPNLSKTGLVSSMVGHIR